MTDEFDPPPPKYTRKSSLTIEVCRADGCAPVVKLTVATPRKTKDDYVTDDCFYAFRRIPCEIGGIGVQFDRLDFDRPERYHVRCVSPGVAECDCMAGSKGVFCKHKFCAEYLIENNELG